MCCMLDPEDTATSFDEQNGLEAIAKDRKVG